MQISDSLIIQLLEDIAIKETCVTVSSSSSSDIIPPAKNVVYIINNNVYKKGVFNGKIAAFYEACKPYYHISKRKYLEKKKSYNSFITVIRQICNSKNITYTSQIKYDKSVYDIIYSISIPMIVGI
jgi:hypothetical protein